MKSYEERDLHAQGCSAINADSTSAGKAAQTLQVFIPKQKEQLFWRKKD